MTRDQLIEELQKFPPGEVYFETDLVEHSGCGDDSPCYCSAETVRFNIDSILSVDSEIKYSGRWKSKHTVVKLKEPIIIIRGEKNYG